LKSLSQLDRDGLADTLTYLHTDHLDTPRLATDPTGTAVWRWDGGAFGETVPNNDPDGDGNLTTVNLRYPGQYFDQETGLHYNWNRYYDPKMGRYITSDPIGLQGGLNTYAYVENNPLRRIGPDGLLGRYGVPPGWRSGNAGSGPCGAQGGFQFPQFSFGSACIRHDECYGTCNANKTWCDFQFQWNSTNSCSAGDWQCRVLSNTYFTALLHGGHGAFRRAQEEACRGCKK